MQCYGKLHLVSVGIKPDPYYGALMKAAICWHDYYLDTLMPHLRGTRTKSCECPHSYCYAKPN